MVLPQQSRRVLRFAYDISAVYRLLGRVGADGITSTFSERFAIRSSSLSGEVDVWG